MAPTHPGPPPNRVYTELVGSPLHDLVLDITGWTAEGDPVRRRADDRALAAATASSKRVSSRLCAVSEGALSWGVGADLDSHEVLVC
jgi:hypothetical protein